MDKFSEGGYVLLRKFNQSKKFDPHYKGPYKIIKITDDNNIVIDLDGYKRKVNISQVKKYHKREDTVIHTNDENSSKNSTDYIHYLDFIPYLDLSEKTNNSRNRDLTTLSDTSEDTIIYNLDDDLKRCTKCSRCFKTDFNFKRHLRVHSGRKPFKYTKCNRTFATKVAKLKHQRLEHPLPFICQNCNCHYALKHQLNNYSCHAGSSPFLT